MIDIAKPLLEFLSKFGVEVTVRLIYKLTQQAIESWKRVHDEHQAAAKAKKLEEEEEDGGGFPSIPR